MNGLSLLVVTEHGPHAAPFLDRLAGIAAELGAEFVEHDGRGARCLEDVLDDAIAACSDGWILRLDDDELPSPEMLDWLRAGRFIAGRHWAFPRMHLWPDEHSFITTAPLWPDVQTRLSMKELAGGRSVIHQGSPFGTGKVAPVAIEHHKFIVRPLEERRALVDRYDAIDAGAGSRFAAFSLPEELADVTLAVRGAVTV